jgi:hypothetical protein
LLQAIKDVYRGESSLYPTIALKLIRELNRPANLPLTEDPLTDREVGVLRLVAQGMTNQDRQKLFSASAPQATIPPILRCTWQTAPGCAHVMRRPGFDMSDLRLDGSVKKR